MSQSLVQPREATCDRKQVAWEPSPTLAKTPRPARGDACTSQQPAKARPSPEAGAADTMALSLAESTASAMFLVKRSRCFTQRVLHAPDKGWVGQTVA